MSGQLVVLVLVLLYMCSVPAIVLYHVFPIDLMLHRQQLCLPLFIVQLLECFLGHSLIFELSNSA